MSTGALSKGASVPVNAAAVRVVVEWKAEGPGHTDADAPALPLGPDGKVRGDGDLVFHNHPAPSSGSVVHEGRRGDGTVVKDTVRVDPAALEPGVDRVLVCASAARPDPQRVPRLVQGGPRRRHPPGPGGGRGSERHGTVTVRPIRAPARPWRRNVGCRPWGRTRRHTTRRSDMRALTAGWGDWLSVFEQHYKALPAAAEGGGCPNCGERQLRLTFTGLEEERIGYAAFWCDGCLFGIHLSRCEVPEGVPMESLHTPVEQRSVRVPNYTLLWPDED